MKLQGKKILLGITGSIAAFKAIDLLRLLQREGADVEVMVSKSALQFVTKITLEALSGHAVLEDLFENGKALEHVHISRRVDLIIIAPTTANMLAKLAYGMADDFMTATVLASSAPVLIAPAMNTQMWKNYLVQQNVLRLKKAGYQVLDTESGLLACGENGEGRFHAVEVVCWHAIKALTPQDLKGKRVLVTAGSTHEHLDPVRFLANGSSGKMGITLAFEAFYRGAEVILIAAHIHQQMATAFPFQVVEVLNAEQMYRAVLRQIKRQDVFVAAAAVADFCFEKTFAEKLSKSEVKEGNFLKLKYNVDILAYIIQEHAKKKKPFLIGFALETDAQEERYRKKFQQKPVDLLVCTKPEAFGSSLIQADLMDRKSFIKLNFMPKEMLSEYIFNHYVKFI